MCVYRWVYRGRGQTADIEHRACVCVWSGYATKGVGGDALQDTTDETRQRRGRDGCRKLHNNKPDLQGVWQVHPGMANSTDMAVGL